MTLLANVFFFVICRLTWFSLHSEINTRAFCLVTVNTQRVTPCYVHVRSRRVSPPSLFHVWLHWVFFCSKRTVWACNFCDLRSSLIEKNFCLQILSVKFHNSYECFWWHGVASEESQWCQFDTMSILGTVQSPGQMCVLHKNPALLKCLLCTIRGSFVVNSVKSGNGPSNWSMADEKHACLPLRSLVPPMNPASKIDL